MGRGFSRRSVLLAGTGLAGAWALGGCGGTDAEPPRAAPRRAAPDREDDIGSVATDWMDDHWDPAAGLLTRWSDPVDHHAVRESAWYAHGLLRRDAEGDRDRAALALGAVLAAQFDQPGSPQHGTFARSPEDPPPPPEPVMWADYDPNWRQFIGTSLALLLVDHGDALPAGLLSEVEAAVDLAASTDPPGRVQASYSNIAVMLAWLLAHTGRPGGEDLAAGVVERFRADGALDEHNSPTYDGTTLYGLGLWRRHPPTPRFAELAGELEAGLWANIAAAYHAGLRNQCGPYDRSYGMDLGVYASKLGMYVWQAVGRDHAPFPDLGRPFEHAEDFCQGPLVAALGTEVPDAVRPQLTEFQGERTEAIGPATSWLSERVMAGGHVGPGSPVGGWMLVPATVHWSLPDGGVGWIRVLGLPTDATARPGQLSVVSKGGEPMAVTVSVPGELAQDRWTLPGLDVTVEGPPPTSVEETDEGTTLTFAPGSLRLGLAPTA